jgi:hypothetical protein
MGRATQATSAAVPTLIAAGDCVGYSQSLSGRRGQQRLSFVNEARRADGTEEIKCTLKLVADLSWPAGLDEFLSGAKSGERG